MMLIPRSLIIKRRNRRHIIKVLLMTRIRNHGDSIIIRTTIIILKRHPNSRRPRHPSSGT